MSFLVQMIGLYIVWFLLNMQTSKFETWWHIISRVTSIFCMLLFWGPQLKSCVCINRFSTHNIFTGFYHCYCYICCSINSCSSPHCFNCKSSIIWSIFKTNCLFFIWTIKKSLGKILNLYNINCILELLSTVWSSDKSIYDRWQFVFSLISSALVVLSAIPLGFQLLTIWIQLICWNAYCSRKYI